MTMAARTSPWRAALVVVFGGWLLLGGGGGSTAEAQIHQIDDPPWPLFDAGGSVSGVALSWQRARDHATRWRVERLGLMLLKPVGERSLVYVRAPYLRLDAADLPSLARWPQVRHESLEPPDAGLPDWPHEMIVNGFGRPEVGFMAPLGLPLAGAGALSLLAGLPFGTDRLYPIAAACLPLVADWRRTVAVTSGLRVDARIGWEQTFAFLADEIDPVGFPSGWRHGVQLGSPAGRARGLWLGYSARELADGRHQRDAVLGGWLPLGDHHRVLVNITRSLTDRDDRWAAWSIAATWHLAGLAPDDAAPAGARGQNATTDRQPPGP